MHVMNSRLADVVTRSGAHQKPMIDSNLSETLQQRLDFSDSCDGPAGFYL
jgi:hypothetical protein